MIYKCNAWIWSRTKEKGKQNETNANEKLEETGLSWSQASSWEVGLILGAKLKSTIQIPNWVPWQRYQLKDQKGYQLSDWKWISNPTQVLSPNSPSNEAELPLYQRHLAKIKLGKKSYTKTKWNTPKQITKKGKTQGRSKLQLEDMTSPKAS